MRVLHIGPCFLIAICSLLVFGVSAVIAHSTRASATPVWVKTCTLHRLHEYAELLCDGYQQQWVVDGTTLLALGPVTIECSAFPTYGLGGGSLEIKCVDLPEETYQ